MASANCSSERNFDISTCSICLETFKDPKLLPCDHTFCLACLEKLCQDKNSGDEVPCPLCRHIFSVPAEGIQAMQTNIFMNQLLHVNQYGMHDTNDPNKRVLLCELCSFLNVEETATSYCTECEQLQCDRCTLIHGKQKMSRSHNTVDVKSIPRAKGPIEMAIRYCEEHSDEEISLYCQNCRTVVCVMCFCIKHRKHECIHIKEAHTSDLDLLESIIEKKTANIQENIEVLKQLKVKKSKFLEAVDAARARISQRYEELLSEINSHRMKLMKELNVFEEFQTKEMQIRKDKIKSHTINTEKYTRYCQEFRDTKTSYNILSRGACKLLESDEELTRSQDQCRDFVDLNVNISFTPSLSVDTSIANLIGKLTFAEGNNVNSDERYRVWNSTALLGQTSLYRAISSYTGRAIRGITVLRSELFIIYFQLSKIDVYDIDSFSLKHSLDIADAKKFSTIAACERNKCIYIGNDDVIKRYDLQSRSVINEWKVNGRCGSLSVTKMRNVLTLSLVFEGRGCLSLREYRANGRPTRVVNIATGMGFLCDPSYCVELSNLEFLVVCSSEAYVVNPNGIVTHSYSTPPINDFDYRDYEFRSQYFTIDKSFYLLAAQLEDRVEILNDQLAPVGFIEIPGRMVKESTVLHLDDERRRLYIASGTHLYVLQAADI